MASTDRNRARLLFGTTAGVAGALAAPAVSQAHVPLDPGASSEAPDTSYSGPSGKADRPDPAPAKPATPAPYSGPSGKADRPDPEPTYSGPSGKADRPAPKVGTQPKPAPKPAKETYSGPSGKADRPDPVVPKAKPKPEQPRPAEPSYSGPSGKKDRPAPVVPAAKPKPAQPKPTQPAYSGPSGKKDRPAPVVPAAKPKPAKPKPAQPSYSGPAGKADRPAPVQPNVYSGPAGKADRPAPATPPAAPASPPSTPAYSGPAGKADRPTPVRPDVYSGPAGKADRPAPATPPSTPAYSGPAGKADRPTPVVPKVYSGPAGKADRPTPVQPDVYSGPAGKEDRPTPVIPETYSGPAGKEDRPTPIEPEHYSGPSGKKDRPAPIVPRPYYGPSGKEDRPDPPPTYVIQVGNKPDLDGNSTGYRIAYPTTPGSRRTLTLGCSAGRGGATRNGMTVACTLLPDGSTIYKGGHRAPAPPKTGPTVEIVVVKTAARTPNVMTTNGETASLQVTTENTLSAGAEAQLKKLNLSVKRIASGSKVTYQITGSPDRIDQITKDPSKAPKAGDPTSIRTGDGLLISDENFKGASGKASAYNVSVEGTRTDGKRKSAGVQRVNGKTIRITVGDDKFVRTVLKAGVGNDVASAGIWHSSDSAKGDYQQVDLDISTPAGWNDYQEFLATGRVAYRPDLTYATGGRRTWSSSGGLYAKLGPLEASSTGISNNGDVRQLKHQDGSVENTTTVSTDDVTFSYSETTKADGTTGSPTTSITLANVSSYDAREFGSRTGGNEGTADGDHDDVRIDFSDKDLDKLRELAIKRIQRVNGELPNVSSSRKDIESGSSAAHRDLPQLALEWNIVNAQTPADRLYALYLGQRGRSNDVLRTLTDWQINGKSSGAPVPGHETILKD